MRGKRARRGKGLFGRVLPFVLFAVLLSLAFAVLGGLDRKTTDEQRDVLINALRKAAVTCYAVEGRYPDSLSYLTEKYGVVIDENSYVVVYDAFASNILPDIRVIRRGATLS